MAEFPANELPAAIQDRVTGDDMYLYRVDSLDNLRAIRDRVFRAYNWSSVHPADRRHPHKPLLALLPDIQPTQGIFRICFWAEEVDARADLAVRHQRNSPCALLRVRTADVRRFLAGWSEGEDDLIGSRARMYWTVQTARKHLGTFSEGGIPINAFQHWGDGVGWTPFDKSVAFAPESVRMAQLGLRSIFYTSFFDVSSQAYWKPVLITKRSGERQIVIALRHARQAQTFLTNDDAAFANVAATILASSLGPVAINSIRFALVLTVNSLPVAWLYRPVPVGPSLCDAILQKIGLQNRQLHTKLRLERVDDLADDELDDLLTEIGLHTDET